MTRVGTIIRPKVLLSRQMLLDAFKASQSPSVGGAGVSVVNRDNESVVGLVGSQIVPTVRRVLVTGRSLYGTATNIWEYDWSEGMLLETVSSPQVMARPGGRTSTTYGPALNLAEIGNTSAFGPGGIELSTADGQVIINPLPSVGDPGGERLYEMVNVVEMTATGGQRKRPVVDFVNLDFECGGPVPAQGVPSAVGAGALP